MIETIVIITLLLYSNLLLKESQKYIISKNQLTSHHCLCSNNGVSVFAFEYGTLKTKENHEKIHYFYFSSLLTS